MGEICRHDESRWINLHVAKYGSASRRWDLVFAKRSRRGILVILPNTTLVTFCQPAAQDDGWRSGLGKEKMKTTLQNKCVCDPFVCGLNRGPLGFTLLEGLSLHYK